MEWRITAGEFGPGAVLDCTINSPDTSTSGGTIISQDISTSGGAEPYDGDGGWCAAPDYPISNYLADRLDARCRAPQSPMFAFNLNSPIPAFAGGGLNILPSFTPSSSLSSLSGQRRGSEKRSVIPGSSCSEACSGCFSTDRCVRFQKNRAGLRKKHQCTHVGCSHATDSKPDLRKHVKAVHDRSQNACPKCYKLLGSRQDNLNRHLNRYCKGIGLV